MTLRDTIKELCKRDNTSLNKLETELEFAKGYISKLDKSTPNSAKLQKIADYFGVSLDYLLGNTSYIRCKDCGYEYSTSDKYQMQEHEKEHEKWKKAVDKFGFCWTYSVSEKEKAKARTRLSSDELTEEEKVNENIIIFKALFSRSLGADFYIGHPDFNSYVAMLLNQKQFKKSIEPKIYSRLVQKYGTKEGLNEGETCYHIPNAVQTIAAHFDGSEYTEDEIEEIKKFAEFVKNRRK